MRQDNKIVKIVWLMAGDIMTVVRRSGFNQSSSAKTLRDCFTGAFFSSQDVR